MQGDRNNDICIGCLNGTCDAKRCGKIVIRRPWDNVQVALSEEEELALSQEDRRQEDFSRVVLSDDDLISLAQAELRVRTHFGSATHEALGSNGGQTCGQTGSSLWWQMSPRALEDWLRALDDLRYWVYLAKGFGERFSRAWLEEEIQKTWWTPPWTASRIAEQVINKAAKAELAEGLLALAEALESQCLETEEAKCANTYSETCSHRWKKQKM